MTFKLMSAFALSLSAQALVLTAQSQETFKDRLQLNPNETCSTGVPEPGDVVAFALKGAKGRNYAIAGNSETARLAIRGEANSVFNVFQVLPAAEEGSVALYSLGHQQFVTMDDKTRLFATSGPESALLFQLEDASEGYFRIKVHGYPTWMRMNVNGYLDFRSKQAEAATSFCAQIVTSD
ncbi:MAG: hypothetical protein ACON4C_02240 [Henriciella sp.]